MDSVTQFALGAALGQAVLGPRIGWRAPLLGGIIATLPDLDVFVPLGDPVADFTYHRSATHSLLVLALVAPVLALLVNRLLGAGQRNYRGALTLTGLALITHPLIDAATVYGTQLAWPLSEHPFAAGSIFIIDPLYTLPLLVGVIVALVAGRTSRRGWWFNTVGLVLSTAYMCLTLVLQWQVQDAMRARAALAGLPTERVLVTPSPFNTVLWRVVVMDKDAYHVGYHSLLAPREEVEFRRYPHSPWLLDKVADAWAVGRLRWFTKGFNAVTERPRGAVISDLRMGAEPASYVFSFLVARRDAAGQMTTVVKPVRIEPEPFPDDAFAMLWRRLTTGRAPTR